MGGRRPTSADRTTILSKGGHHLSVPVHAGKELGKGLLHELLKRAGLK
jgi:predicted RNA binding protein YcfA (HicA-like mRNA interferase family)